MNSNDTLRGQLRELRSADSPLQFLIEWVEENVDVMTGLQKSYTHDMERVQYRLEVQQKILQLVDEGRLNARLRSTKVRDFNLFRETVNAN